MTMILGQNLGSWNDYLDWEKTNVRIYGDKDKLTFNRNAKEVISVTTEEKKKHPIWSFR